MDDRRATAPLRVVVAAGFESSSRKAHAINTVKMAQGFARLGHTVTLVCRSPAAGPLPTADLARDLGLTAPLTWRQLPTQLGRGYPFAAAVASVALSHRADFVYARSFTVPWVTARLGVPTAAESHAHVGNRSPGLLSLTRTAQHDGFAVWVTISDVLADYYRSLGAPAVKLLTLPDAVDLEAFAPPPKLPPDPYGPGRPRVVYSGHLYDYKGIPTVLAAAARLPDYAFHLVGGLPEDVQRTRQAVAGAQLDNVTLHGLLPHAQVPPYLWHADVLLLPPSADHPSARWTSPVKLGEYLASGVPVVSTAIPALQDWLSDAETRFVAPDDPADLAAGIRAVVEDRALARRLSEAGQRRAAELSYKRRAAQVLAYPQVVSRLGRPWPLGLLASLWPGGGRHG